MECPVYLTKAFFYEVPTRKLLLLSRVKVRGPSLGEG